MDDVITIRSCNAQDAEAIMSIGIRTFRDTFDEMNTPENMMLYLNQNFTLKKIRQEIAEKGSTFLFAQQYGKTVGYARIRTSENPKGLTAKAPIEIERLYVDRDYIGKRVGYLLMNAWMEYAREGGHDAVWLGVWEHNERAIAFYKKWGFTRFSEHTFMLGKDAQTDWLLRKELK